MRARLLASRAASLLLALLLAASRECSGVFRVVAPVLENDDPLRGASPEGIPHKFAAFGRGAFGGRTIAAPLVLAPVGDIRACAELNRTALDAALAASGLAKPTTVAGDESESERAFVLMVERGECPFDAKVRHAQQAGAAAVVVFNAEENNDDVALVTMTNDGTTADIRIPSLLVHRADAERLLALARSSPKTIVQLRWSAARSADEIVELALWSSSRSEPAVRAFVRTFADVLRAFEAESPSRLRFTPYFDVFDGAYWGCGGDSDASRAANASSEVPGGTARADASCDKLCVYEHRFCTYDPEWDATTGLDGRDVLAEDVRQLCVAQATDGSGARFLDYVAAFDATCSVPDATAQRGFTRACSRQVLAALDGVSADAVAACERDRGDALLAAQLRARARLGVVAVPLLAVNDVPLPDDALACPAPVAPATCAPLRAVCREFEAIAAEAPGGVLPRACSDAFWAAAAPCAPPLERDACGDCALRSDAASWNARCAGCDGVAHSGATRDACGACLPPQDPARGRSCADCEGVPNGPARRDACGVCGGRGSFDACGLCLDARDPRRQSARCRVAEDPDAVRAKAELEGVRPDEVRGEVLAGFQRAVAAAAGARADDVLLQSVARCGGGGACAELFFFVACADAEARAAVAARLRDPSAALAVAIKMRAHLDEVAFGLDASASVERVRLHSVSSDAAVDAVSALHAATAADSAVQGSTEATSKEAGGGVSRASVATVVLGALCLATLVAGLVALRARDNRIRREFQQMFAAYTPLTSLDQEEERGAGFAGA